MERYYDSVNRRLIYIKNAATSQYWDEQWIASDIRKSVTANANSWVSRISKQYLPKGAHVLEGGCGNGNQVYALMKAGFNSVGVDFAEQTVKTIREIIPELTIELGDVRQLPFDSESFDGYWSLGVIEHFWNGYKEIAQEMQRVIRKGGYLFLTFPFMSPLRQWKAKKNFYPLWTNYENEPTGFYQFALSTNQVIEDFYALGFKLKSIQGLDGLKGIKDEFHFSKKMLQRIYNSKMLISKIFHKSANVIFSKPCGHSCLLIMQKT